MLSDKISDRTIVLLILYNNSLKNFASPQGIWIFHFSLFTLHFFIHLTKQKVFNYLQRLGLGFV